MDYKEEAKKLIYHDSCEDPWYSCPLSPEGCYNDDLTECNCGYDGKLISLTKAFQKIAQQAREEADYYVRVVTLEEVAILFDSSTLRTEWSNNEISEFIRSLKTKGQD